MIKLKAQSLRLAFVCLWTTFNGYFLGRQPVPIDDFERHVDRMHMDGDHGFSEEYLVRFACLILYHCWIKVFFLHPTVKWIRGVICTKLQSMRWAACDVPAWLHSLLYTFFFFFSLSNPMKNSHSSNSWILPTNTRTDTPTLWHVGCFYNLCLRFWVVVVVVFVCVTSRKAKPLIGWQ